MLRKRSQVPVTVLEHVLEHVEDLAKAPAMVLVWVVVKALARVPVAEVVLEPAVEVAPVGN